MAVSPWDATGHCPPNFSPQNAKNATLYRMMLINQRIHYVYFHAQCCLVNKRNCLRKLTSLNNKTAFAVRQAVPCYLLLHHQKLCSWFAPFPPDSGSQTPALARPTNLIWSATALSSIHFRVPIYPSEAAKKLYYATFANLRLVNLF